MASLSVWLDVAGWQPAVIIVVSQSPAYPASYWCHGGNI